MATDVEPGIAAGRWRPQVPAASVDRLRRPALGLSRGRRQGSAGRGTRSADEACRGPRSVGVPVWGGEIRLVDESGPTIDEFGPAGEIAVRADTTSCCIATTGRRPPPRPSATGSYIGDLGCRDDDCSCVVDRVEDIIVRSGYKVCPRGRGRPVRALGGGPVGGARRFRRAVRR